jgi:hypothetical protein
MAANMHLSAGYACASIVGVTANESMLHRIEPFDPLASYMFHKLRGTQFCPEAGGYGSRMPLGSPCLAPASIGTLREWILEGAICN